MRSKHSVLWLLINDTDGLGICGDERGARIKRDETRWDEMRWDETTASRNPKKRIPTRRMCRFGICSHNEMEKKIKNHVLLHFWGGNVNKYVWCATYSPVCTRSSLDRLNKWDRFKSGGYKLFFFFRLWAKITASTRSIIYVTTDLTNFFP